MDWTERYRPRTLKDIVGNGPSIAQMKAWAEAWRQGIPKIRALILSGPPGTGKTSAAIALAHDMGWSLIELNASDARNADAIRKVATAGALHQTFASDGSFGSNRDGERKLIVLDEADNLYERLSGENAAGGGSNLSDKGGKAQIIETIRQTRQPIILIVNDLYELQKGSGAALKSLTETLKFTRVNVRSIPAALGRICQEEGIQVDRDVLESIAVKSDGDLRAAVRDLESICVGRKHVTVKELASLGVRDTTTNMFDLMRHIFKGRAVEEVRREVWDVDATPEDLVLWVDENIPKEYKHPEDLVRAYYMLSRADQFLGRTRSTQNYGLWSYAGELATLGVMTARHHEYRGFTPFGFPQWLSKMSRSRGLRGTKDRLASSLAQETHSSRRKARLEQVEVFSQLFQHDPEFALEQTLRLDLDDDDVALLMGEKSTSKAVKEIRAAVTARQGEVAAVGMTARKPGPLSKLMRDASDDAGTDAADDVGADADNDHDSADDHAAADDVAGDADDIDGDTNDVGDEVDEPVAKDEARPSKPQPGAGQSRLF